MKVYAITSRQIDTQMDSDDHTFHTEELGSDNNFQTDRRWLASSFDSSSLQQTSDRINSRVKRDGDLEKGRNQNQPRRKISTANRIYMVPSPDEHNQLSQIIGSNIKSQQQQRI